MKTKMRTRIAALALVLTMLLALGAYAASGSGSGEPPAPAEYDASRIGSPEPYLPGEAPPASAQPAEESAAPQQAADPAGTLSFENLGSRIRENNLTLRSLGLQLETIEKTDLEHSRKDLVDAINAVADVQWMMLASPATAMGATQLQSSYDTLRKQLDDMKDGKTARSLESGRRQLVAAGDQLVYGMESAFIQLKALEEQNGALTRGLAALDRGIQKANISFSHGLVSQLTLDQLAAQRQQLVSTQETLRMGMELIALNLKAAVGLDLDETLAFSALPKVTAEQLSAMDLEADLLQAKAKSAALYDAMSTLEDAHKAYKDATYKQTLQRSWQSAQYTYDAQLQSFELKFRTLYLQVKDYAQQVEAARSALAQEEENYSVASIKFRQEAISANDLADAKDTLDTAKEKVSAAERTLLTNYRSYYWAVEHGILN